MKFAVAVHGTRGDVEPCVAVVRELRGRGHDVRLAVPPNLVPFVEKAGSSPVLCYGVDSQQQLDAAIFRRYWKIQNPVTALRDLREYVTQGWTEMSTTLTELADGSDLVLTGTTYQEVAANVAEYHGIPLAALHFFPARSNSRVLPLPLGPRLSRSVMTALEWGFWRVLKTADDGQRRDLGLPKATVHSVRRIVERGTLEIQAYDELFFPGLAAEWQYRRPFVGSITMELATDDGAEVHAWIGASTPPIYFGFGSMPIPSPADTIALITGVCAELGERALICSAGWNIDRIPVADHVKIVPTVNHAAALPRCRAVVHHGGAGTTAAGLRAGVPTLVLWIGADQPCWGAQVKRLNVGISRSHQRFGKLVAKHGYSLMTRRLGDEEVRFLNWGYEEDPPMSLPLAPADEIDRYCIQLYHRVANQVDLAGKQVLEVSCGHGGAASYLSRTQHPAGYTGLDLNPAGIAFCRRTYTRPGLRFVHGDAENLPFPDASFDAVVNVEAAHLYPDYRRFLAEVARVLRPGGHFLYADLRATPQIAQWEADLAACPLRQISQEVINTQVLRGLEHNSTRYQDLINRHAPVLLRRLGRDVAVTKGSPLYDDVTAGRISYRLYCFAKA